MKFSFDLELTKSYELEEEEKKGKNLYVEGFASTSDVDLEYDQIAPEALKGAAGDLIGTTLLFNHNANKPVGLILEAKVKEGGLWIKAMISKTVPDIWKQVKEVVLNKFSIRGRVLSSVKRYSAEVDRVINYVKKLILFETSLVPLPGNPKAKSIGWYISKSYGEKNMSNSNVEIEDLTPEVKLIEKGEKEDEEEVAEEVEEKVEEVKEEEKTEKITEEKVDEPEEKEEKEIEKHEEIDKVEEKKDEEVEKQQTATSVLQQALKATTLKDAVTLIGQAISLLAKYPYPYPAQKDIDEMKKEIGEIKEEISKGKKEIRKGLVKGEKMADLPEDPEKRLKVILEHNS